MNFTEEFARAEHERLVGAFIKKYPRLIDRAQAHHEQAVIQETVRGLYVMVKWQSEGSVGNPVAWLRQYSMLSSVVPEFTATYLSQVKTVDVAIPRTEKRKDKYGTFDKWASEHQGEEYTTEQLVEIGGFSYPTTLKHISESPLFVKVKKGIWRIATPDKGDEPADE